ncbi:MAG TPA: hypothetical protein VJR27_00120 [Candidatus Saccharimonadales bacterium]|nr:hypothetical protein [Candidatus Saccharimonadales bacterium]
MTFPEGHNFDPTNLTLEQMQEELLGRGWEHSVSEYDVSTIERSYARVNPALEGHNWRDAIAEFPSVLDDTAPYLPRGLGISTAGKETEVTVGLLADLDDVNDVTKVYILDSHLRERGFEEVDEKMLADWLVMKGEPGAARIGSKEYYEQNPRSAELREIGVELIEQYTRVIAEEGMEGEAMERLLELNQKLAQLAIEPNMHTGAPAVEFVDPVIRAEWVTGVLRNALLEGWGFSGKARAVLEEHDILAGAGGEMKIIDMQSPSEAPSTASLLMGLASLSEHLDSEADDSER